MGGNLLHNWGLPKKRLSAADYFVLCNELTYRLWDYPGRVWITETYRQKESFGDVDVLIEAQQNFDYRAWVKEKFGVEPVSSGSCYSFPFEEFQVDLIICRPKYFHTSVHYHFAELGMFEGIIFNKFGLKFSTKGLCYDVKSSLFEENSGGHKLKEVILTQNPRDICAVGGFDFERRQAGFQTLEEIFEYIGDSEFFNPRIFDFENLNSENRNRNKNRATFVKFVEWCQGKPDGFEFERRREYLPAFIRMFPHLGEAIEKERLAYDQRKKIKEKFDGRRVMEWTGVKEGKEVGRLVREFRARFSPEEILAMKDVKDEFLKLCK